jgi:hypothetical protein
MKQKAWLSVLSLLFTLAIVLGALAYMHPTSSHAASSGKFPIAGMKPNGSSKVVGGSGNLTYHGGPVMAGTSKDYLIFWFPTGSTVSSQYVSVEKIYFKNIGSSKLYHNNTQYTDSSSNFPSNSVYGGQFLDTQPYPANPMTDAQVQAEVTHAMSVKGWTSSLDHAFFVFTAAGEHNLVGDQNNFCAYHSAFGTDTIYAAMIYPTVLAGCDVSTPTPHNDQDADSEANFSSHEQMESATDPLLNAWYDTNLGGEIGDKCDFVFAPRGPRGGDIDLNNNHFILQEEWSNAKSGCVIKGP